MKVWILEDSHFEPTVIAHYEDARKAFNNCLRRPLEEYVVYSNQDDDGNLTYLAVDDGPSIRLVDVEGLEFLWVYEDPYHLPRVFVNRDDALAEQKEYGPGSRVSSTPLE